MKMNENIFKKQNGSILLETLLSMNLLIFIMASFSVVFLSMIQMYLKNLYQMELRSQMRFAAECIIQDIKHADSVMIYQENGYDVIFITTRAVSESNDSQPAYIKYRQDDLAFYPRIIKKNQPITGDNSFCDTYVRFTCKPLSNDKNNRVFLLEFKGTHKLAKKYFYLETAVTMLGKRTLD